MNEVILIGNLTRDPSLAYTPTTNTPVASFRLAVSRQSRDGGADFIPCKTFGRQAENLERFKHKGDELAVRGRIETGSYKNKDGETVYTTEVICDRIEFIRGNKGAPSGETTGEPKFEPAGKLTPSVPDTWQDDISDPWEAAEDDIPF